MHEASCKQALLVMQVRDLEMDQQLMQHDMEELSKQAQQAVELLRSALGAACKLLHSSSSCMTVPAELDRQFCFAGLAGWLPAALATHARKLICSSHAA